MVGNVLRSGSALSRHAQPRPEPDYDTDSFNRAREALIDDVVMYAGRDFEAIIVFDGADNEYPMAALKKSLVYALCSRVRAIPPIR